MKIGYYWIKTVADFRVFWWDGDYFLENKYSDIYIYLGKTDTILSYLGEEPCISQS